MSDNRVYEPDYGDLILLQEQQDKARGTSDSRFEWDYMQNAYEYESRKYLRPNNREVLRDEHLRYYLGYDLKWYCAYSKNGQFYLQGEESTDC